MAYSHALKAQDRSPPETIHPHPRQQGVWWLLTAGVCREEGGRVSCWRFQFATVAEAPLQGGVGVKKFAKRGEIQLFDFQIVGENGWWEYRLNGADRADLVIRDAMDLVDFIEPSCDFLQLVRMLIGHGRRFYHDLIGNLLRHGGGPRCWRHFLRVLEQWEAVRSWENHWVEAGMSPNPWITNRSRVLLRRWLHAGEGWKGCSGQVTCLPGRQGRHAEDALPTGSPGALNQLGRWETFSHRRRTNENQQYQQPLL